MTDDNGRRVTRDRRRAAQAGIAEILAESRSFEDAVPGLVRTIGEDTRSDFVAIWIVDSQHQLLVCEGTWQSSHLDAPDFEKLTLASRFGRGEGLPGQAWSEGKSVWISDLAASDFPRSGVAGSAGLHGGCASPVVLQGEVLGIIEFFSREPRAPDPELAGILATAGHQIGGAIERWGVEKALRESEERFRVMAETASDAIFTIDENDVILFANRSAERIFGYKLEEIVGNQLTRLIPERFRAAHLKGIARFRETEKRHIPWQGVELPGLRADGVEIPLELSFGVFQQYGHFFFTGFARDISERSRAQKEREDLLALEQVARKTAEKAERRASFLVDATEALVSSLDYEETLGRLAGLIVPELADWCLITVQAEDGAVERIAVEHRDERLKPLGKGLRRRYRVDEQARSGVVHVLRTGKSELHPSVPDSLIPLLVNGSEEEAAIARQLGVTSAMIVPLAVGQRVLGTVTLLRGADAPPFSEDDLQLAEDLGRRASLPIDNSRLYKEAQAANKAKDEFLATVSHELRTPMTAVLGWARVLRIDRAPETISEAVEAIERSATAQAQLIEDILDVSRISVGKIRFRIEPVDLGTVIESAVDTVGINASNKGVKLRSEVDHEIPPFPGDPQRLQQVVWNLLSNAIKFTPAGGEIVVKLERVEEIARISVSDNGVGIPVDFLPFVFDRFRQAESSTTRSHGGLGLGLAIVRHLVDLHGGSIRVESAGEGKGATFLIDLPLVGVGVSTGDRKARTRATDLMPSLAGIHILLVEDDNDTRQFIDKVLGRSGATVDAASSVSEALEMLAARRPDVLVSDLAMPVRDGYDLIRMIREQDSIGGTHLPSLALTASGTAGDRERALAAGFDEYMRKPFEPLSLMQRIVKMVPGSA